MKRFTTYNTEMFVYLLTSDTFYIRHNISICENMKIVLCLQGQRPTKLIAAGQFCLYLNRDKTLKLLFMA